MEHFSSFPGYDRSKDALNLFSRILEFFTTEYLVCIHRDELHIIYDRDVVFELPCPEDCGGGVDGVESALVLTGWLVGHYDCTQTRVVIQTNSRRSHMRKPVFQSISMLWV